MKIKLSSNTYTKLTSGISDNTTTIPVQSTSNFPTINTGDGEYFYLDIITSSGDYETVKVTNVNQNNLTVVRAQGGTTARAFLINDICGLRVNTAVIDAIVAEILLSLETQVFSSTVLEATVATGTAPLNITSTTLVQNLNVDLLDGQHGSYYTNASNLSTGTVAAQRLGSGTPSSSNYLRGDGAWTTPISSSSDLAGLVGDETGSNLLVFNTSPTFTTSVITDSQTFAIFNTVATTINAFGAATTLNLGASSGTTTINNSLTVTGNLTINGTTNTVNSTIVTIDDPIFTLGGDTAPIADDNKDRGIEFRWHTGSVAKVGFFGYDDSAQAFTFIPDATNTSEVFSGTAGDVIFGKVNKVTITTPTNGSTLTIADGKTLSVSNTLTFTGTDSSSVAFGSGGTVAYTSGKINQFAATSSAELSDVISNKTGYSTGALLVFSISPVLATPDLNTNAKVGGTWVANSTWTLPAYTLGGTVSGGGNQINNVVIGTSTPLAGYFTTLTGITLSSTGNTTLGDADTDTLTFNAQFVTGTQLKTGKTIGNTLYLSAYDVDGVTYSNLITLTASNTPTLAITSIGTGTINNISVGATTAASGAFTTLSASSTVSGDGFTNYFASPPAIGGTVAGLITGSNLMSKNGLWVAAAYSGTTFTGGTVVDYNSSIGRISVGTNADIAFYYGGVGSTEIFRLTATKNVVVGTAALATNATAGFLWISSCAGLPTGIPTAPYTNAAAIVADSANNKLYFKVGANSWTAVGTGGVGSSVTITDDNITNTSYYLGMSSITTGTWETAYVSSMKLYFNPSTGTLYSTIFSSLSDISLKENIFTILNGLDIVNELNPVEFTWKDTSKKSYGVIAQELEQILPELVTNTNGIKSVEYQSLIGLLISAVQKLSNKINSLEVK